MSQDNFHAAVHDGYTPVAPDKPLNASEQQLFTDVLLSQHADIFHSDEEDATQNGFKIKRRVLLEWRAPHATRTLHTLDLLHAADNARRAVRLGTRPGSRLSDEQVALLVHDEYAPFVVRHVLDEWMESSAAVSQIKLILLGLASEILVLIACLCLL